MSSDDTSYEDKVSKKGALMGRNVLLSIMELTTMCQAACYMLQGREESIHSFAIYIHPRDSHCAQSWRNKVSVIMGLLLHECESQSFTINYSACLL